MRKMGFAARWWEGAFVSLSLLVSGCATLANSQENFANRKSACAGWPLAKGIMASPFKSSLVFYAIWFIGLFVSSAGGHYIVSGYVKTVKKSLGIKDKSSSLALVAGCAERAVYTAAFILGWYVVIALLFVLKAAKAVVNCIDLDTKKTGRIVTASLLGNFLSLGIAILAGAIMKYLFMVLL